MSGIMPSSMPAWAEDMAILLVQDDPDVDGGAVGPSGPLNPNLGIQCAVVWSGAWDDAIWDEVMARITRHNMRAIVILTQTQQHAAWVRSVGRIPVMEIKP